MNFIEKSKEFLTKLQNLPENQKKIILWAIVGILAAAMGYFWVSSAMRNLSTMGESMEESIKNINLPDFTQIE